MPFPSRTLWQITLTFTNGENCAATVATEDAVAPFIGAANADDGGVSATTDKHEKAKNHDRKTRQDAAAMPRMLLPPKILSCIRAL